MGCIRNWIEPMIDRWDDLPFLLALARAQTLTAAATALRVSQPTVGRHISSLEKKLGTPLSFLAPQGTLPARQRVEENTQPRRQILATRIDGKDGNLRRSPLGQQADEPAVGDGFVTVR